MSRVVTRVPRPSALIHGAGLTHSGRLREVNEDSILTDPSGTLWAVADGMGGHGHGDLAADIVIDHLSAVPHGEADGRVIAAIAAADTAIRARARAEGFGQMGATVVVAAISRGRASVYWVGDSRAYRVRNGGIVLLTHDHSVIQDMIDRGQLSRAEAERHPQAHVVTRAVGAGPPDRGIAVDRVETDLASGDALVLCSDGLTRCVEESEIAAIVDASREPETACRRLIEAALLAGAPDNVSVITVCIGGGGRL
jgi:PPM family protein phosphatase